MKRLIASTALLLLCVVSYAQEGKLYAVRFKTDGGVLLSTQNLAAPKNSDASNIKFFTKREENPVAYYPFGSIKDIGTEFDMLDLFSKNIPFIYKPESTKFYLAFSKEKTAGDNFVMTLAEQPIVEAVDENSMLLFLPTKFKSKEEALALIEKLQVNFDEDYYKQFVSFGMPN